MDEKLEKNREYLVVKGNDLIQKSRFELSLPEQKTIAYICSKIKPAENGQPFLLEYDFEIREYCKICGIHYDSGKNYEEIKATLKHLRDRSMWLTLEDGSETLVGWLAKVTTNKRSGMVKIRIDEDLAPYLFGLGKRFTQYQLKNILGMKSAFSVRIYEILKSYAYKKTMEIELDELKCLLAVDKVKSYNRFPDFRRKVLEIAMREINELTDLEVSYETILKGKKVVGIRFDIATKDAIGRAIADKKTSMVLDNL